MQCIFVSDLHGNKQRYKSLFTTIEKEKPYGVFIGGDLLPGGLGINIDVDKFLQDMFFSKILKLKQSGINTIFFIILGNDDPRAYAKLASPLPRLECPGALRRLPAGFCAGQRQKNRQLIDLDHFPVRAQAL